MGRTRSNDQGSKIGCRPTPEIIGQFLVVVVVHCAKRSGGSMTDPGMDRATEIERLAALESINYEVVRRAEAKRLGMRPGILDQEIAKARRALGLQRNGDDLRQGRAIRIPEILPWADAIEGDRVATGLASALKRYVVLSDAAADTIALWILHTWLVDKFTITPRLAITSPTKGCGKTTILRFLNQVVRRPKRAGSISLAALFSGHRTTASDSHSR
jgi:putative DNA primase/helicase